MNNKDTNRCIQALTLDFGKWKKMHDISKRVYSTQGIAPTIHTCGGGNIEPKIIEDFEKCKTNERKKSNKRK